MLSDSGHHIVLEIVIENGEVEAAADFLASHHGRKVPASASRRDVFIVSSVPENPDQGNKTKLKWRLTPTSWSSLDFYAVLFTLSRKKE